MNATEKYNGWTNYETWSVNLLLTNDEGSDRYWREAADETWENAEPDSVNSKSESARYTLAERLKDEHGDALETMLAEAKQECSLWSQLLHASLSDVDWDEIADSLLCRSITDYERSDRDLSGLDPTA